MLNFLLTLFATFLIVNIMQFGRKTAMCYLIYVLFVKELLFVLILSFKKMKFRRIFLRDLWVKKWLLITQMKEKMTISFNLNFAENGKPGSFILQRFLDVM